MKRQHDRPSVARLTALLRRSRLLPEEEVGDLVQRWWAEASDAEDIATFARWLVANRFATEFQVALLLHDQAEHFFLGPYKLLERIGRGRLATVYKAVHRLGHAVAIKVLPPARARDARALARFRHEAGLAQRLDHPQVVRTLEGGVEGRLHYLVMEYLEGETLEQVLHRRGKLPPDEAADIVRQALLGLGHLHQLGLVHRNLEPANLMLLRPVAGGVPLPASGWTVKVLDISLARDGRADAGAAPSSKGDDLLALMAPHYRAPEMALEPEAADIRADIYTLGCVLFHALSGAPPYDDPTPMGQLIRHATESPPPLRRVNPDVPEGLERIVAWMLDRDPARRYPTPERAALALEGYLQAATALDPGQTGAGAPTAVDLVPVANTDVVAPARPRTPVEPAIDAGSPSVWSAAVDPEADAADPAEDILSRPRFRGVRRRPSAGSGPSPRDAWFLLLGGVGLLAAQLLGWLVAWAAR